MLKNLRTQTEIVQTLEDVQATLEVLVEHMGLQGQVQSAIGARRVETERARLALERFRGESDAQGDSRR